MGTNFYFFTKEKSAAEDRFPVSYELTNDPEFGYRIHIAKTSCGWLPLFQAHANCHSVNEMKTIYDTGFFQIIDEYGERYDWEEFRERVLEFNGGVAGAQPQISVERNKSAPFYDANMPDHIPVSHFEYADGAYAEEYFKDSQGYEFDERWFC